MRVLIGGLAVALGISTAAGAQPETLNLQMDGAALALRLKAQVPQARLDLESCYRANVLRLGVANVESADTLLLGVAAICRANLDRLAVLYVPEIQGVRKVEALVAADRRKAEEMAVAALLEARAAKGAN